MKATDVEARVEGRVVARVGVVGASGYAGAVAARLVATHPRFALAFCTSDRLAGASVESHLDVPVPAGLAFAPNAEAMALAEGCDAVVLATSAEVSAELAPRFVDRGRDVIDLSGAFRLEHAVDYAQWYKLEHHAPAWLARAHYGLPEVFGPPRRLEKERVLVANPGCYPTAAILALAPLLRARLIEPQGIIIDAKSGVTGAGRQSAEPFSFVEVDEDLRAYKLLAHQHTPEIARALRRIAPDARLTFTPHLVPAMRGLLATCYARPREGATAARVAECLADAYAGAAFVRTSAPDAVSFHRVAGTNLARVGATASDDVVIAVAAIDNLLKGAAGQAIQNMNLLYGLDESAGLSHLQRFAP